MENTQKTLDTSKVLLWAILIVQLLSLFTFFAVFAIGFFLYNDNRTKAEQMPPDDEIRVDFPDPNEPAPVEVPSFDGISHTFEISSPYPEGLSYNISFTAPDDASVTEEMNVDDTITTGVKVVGVGYTLSASIPGEFYPTKFKSAEEAFTHPTFGQIYFVKLEDSDSTYYVNTPVLDDACETIDSDPLTPPCGSLVLQSSPFILDVECTAIDETDYKVCTDIVMSMQFSQ